MRRGLLLLVAPLALVACGGGGKQQVTGPKLDPVAFVRHAAHSTAAAPSEHVTMNGTTSVAGTTATIKGTGDFRNAKLLGSMHASFSAAGTSGQIDEVLSGTSLYMSSPLFSGLLPSGKTWAKLDFQKALASKGINFSQLLGQTPAQSLKQLAAAGEVTKVGTETIDGVETTHYRAHIDPSKLPQGAKIEALTHAKYGATDIWIGNSDGYIHRTTEAYSYSASGRSVSTRLTMDFSKFGESVHVTVPPASETYDMTNAAIQGLGG